jgi:rubredoxin
MNTLTIAELDERLSSYGIASARRDKRIIIVTCVTLVLVFFTAFNYPSFIILPLAALAGLAVFVIMTCHRWHQRHGAFCQHCKHSLIALGEQLEEIHNGKPVPDSFSCPHCGEIVARPPSNNRDMPMST